MNDDKLQNSELETRLETEIAAEIEALRDALLTTGDEVSAALEGEDEKREIAAHDNVEALAQRYSALIARHADAKERIEHAVGRRITDLRRAADQLSKRASGRTATLAADAGSVPFLDRRAYQNRPSPTAFERPRDRPRFSVGGDVEAWCGKCGDLREHRIVAMVGDEPKQVLCETCGSRHGYRTSPTRAAASARADAPGTTTAPAYAGGATKIEQSKREADKRALHNELATAENPRPFEARGRYKAGEIIVHPVHGRGKIENVLRNSMLVRFLDGLRPVDLF